MTPRVGDIILSCPHPRAHHYHWFRCHEAPHPPDESIHWIALCDVCWQSRIVSLKMTAFTPDAVQLL